MDLRRAVADLQESMIIIAEIE